MSRKEEFEKYYKYYTGNTGDKTIVDAETSSVGETLCDNVYGNVLDLGCGNVPMAWAIFMKNAHEISAVDLPPESIDFIKEKLKEPEIIAREFTEYQDYLETYLNKKLGENYIENQIKKIKKLDVCDMSKSIPFDDEYFDSIVALFSMGCLKNPDEVTNALININRKLKTNGILIHTDTDGRNRNNILPEYYWKGLNMNCDDINNVAKDIGFELISQKKVQVNPIAINYHNIYINILVKTKSV